MLVTCTASVLTVVALVLDVQTVLRVHGMGAGVLGVLLVPSGHARGSLVALAQDTAVVQTLRALLLRLGHGQELRRPLELWRVGGRRRVVRRGRLRVDGRRRLVRAGLVVVLRRRDVLSVSNTLMLNKPDSCYFIHIRRRPIFIKLGSF